MTKLNRIAACSIAVILLLATVRIVAGATFGFTTWEQGGRTNTIQSGDTIALSIVQGTASNIYATLMRIPVGTGNSMTNDLRLISSDYFNLSTGTVTNGFYNGKVFDMSSAVTYALTNKGNFLEGRMGLSGSQYVTGTGLVATVTFQGYNSSPTNLVVPVSLGYVQVGRSGGTWTTAGGTWASLNANYGNSFFTYVRILTTPNPRVSGVMHDAGNSTVTLTTTLDPGTSNVVLYCTELGGSESPATNIVIPIDAPDKVTTNIAGLPAPGPKGFWRIKSIREGSGAEGSASASQQQRKLPLTRRPKR
jgi:hypothetical protein